MYNHAPKRQLLIFFGQSDGTYHFINKSENIVYSHDMGGVSNPFPFGWIKINDGFFSVMHSGGMGSIHMKRITTFKYSLLDKEFYLYKEEGESGQFSDNLTEINKTSIIETEADFGKLQLNKYSIYDNTIFER
jgi:hypothetical protein